MRITANHVTMARIILLPVPVAMLIYGHAHGLAWWFSFSIFVLLGTTDFIDGLMARREGPTKLGSLLDPVADKIFIAAIFMTFSAIGIFPPWVLSALLSREFLLTALRSSVAIRQESIKTSRLAKIKTIFQMGGAGTIFFTIVLPAIWSFYLCLALSIPFLAVAIIYWAQKKKAPDWALPVFLAFFVEALVTFFASKEANLLFQVTLIIALTWASALNYLGASYRFFRRTGIFFGDGVRLLWALSYGLLVSPLVANFPLIVLPLLLSISFELGLGGIDNIVVIEKSRFRSWPFIFSSAAALIFVIFSSYISMFYLSIILAGSSMLICAIVFIKNIDIFKKSF